MSIYQDGSNWRLLAAREALEMKVQHKLGFIKNISELSNADLMRLIDASPTQQDRREA